MNISPDKTPLPRALLLLAAGCCTWLGTPAFAQQNDQSATITAVTEAPEKQLSYDLGGFQLSEVRPTRNETTKAIFQAYFLMSPDISRQDLEKLAHWKHRFRDQIIIAVRTAQTKDFHEPQLKRIRRIILFRVRRMMRESVVEDVLFTEFTFSVE
jgi:flagellar basal body-associated protein FliL